MNLKNFIENDNKNVSIYATSEFLNEFIEANDVELDKEDSDNINILDEYELVVLSKCVYGDKYWWILEPMFYKGKQLFNECNVLFVEEEIIDIVDFDKIEADEIIFFGCEKNECCEEDVPEIVEDILDEVVGALEYEDNCSICIIRDALAEIYEIGRKDGVLDAIDRLEELL